MPDCQEEIYSNDYYDFIVANEFIEDLPEEEYCIQTLSDNYSAVYYQMEENGLKMQMQMQNFSYSVIPKCFGLLNNEALGESGILKVRDQPNLALTGRGVLMGFIDTEECVKELYAESGTVKHNLYNLYERKAYEPAVQDCNLSALIERR